MNPFNWNGPEFLAFYLILAIALIGAQVWMRRTREAEAHSPGKTPKLTDPYLVAYLAGGVNALVRCSTVSLLEQKVLLVADTKKKNELVRDPDVHRLDHSPIDGVVAHFFDQPHAAHEVFSGMRGRQTVTTAGEQYRAALVAAGLLPSAAQLKTNTYEALYVSLILLAAGLAKLYLAYERGHHNVWFLIFLMNAVVAASFFVARRRKTRYGREALADLKQLFGGLKNQTKAGAFVNVSPADVAFVAAVFGLGALGGARAVYAKSLFPASSSSSGCGSGCGSSGGDGGGGGCGGGGCGGCGG